MSTLYSSTPGQSRARPWRRWTLVDDESEGDNGSQESQEAPERDLLAEKERRIEELTGDLKRVQADFENYKKRVDKEWAERSKIATQKLMTDLLAVLDSFDKALQDGDEGNSPKDAREGLEGLHRQFLQVLQREGLREVKTEGRFDPFLHEALMREEREGADDDQILEVYQKGYQLGSKTIRPARVKVARAKVPGDQSERDEVQDDESTDSQDNEEHESER